MDLLRHAWTLFDERERWKALGLLFLMILGAGFEALGVGLIMPFIALLAEPGAMHALPVLGGLFEEASDKEILIWAGV
ncbi:MAG: ABC transporter ATP-binding protein, partial [Bradymonadaceae bacterium]